MVDKDGQIHTGYREDYNFFIFSDGAGPGPFTVRTRLLNGKELIDKNVRLQESGRVYM